jgi:hypothetical protein
MAGFLITAGSVLLCPHGGVVKLVVTHPAATASNGEPIVFLDDPCLVMNCVLDSLPCTTVTWATASTTRFDNGVPAIDTSSVGICMGGGAVANGSVTIASHSQDWA